MKYILIIIAIALLVWGGYAMMKRGGKSAAPADQTAGAASGGTQLDEREIKTFTVTGKPFSFTPSTIEVNKGDTVRIVFRNEEGAHNWTIDQFNAKTQVLQAGQSETIQFYANQKGTFEYYCSVGTHRQQGMKGTLIVN